MKFLTQMELVPDVRHSSDQMKPREIASRARVLPDNTIAQTDTAMTVRHAPDQTQTDWNVTLMNVPLVKSCRMTVHAEHAQLTKYQPMYLVPPVNVEESVKSLPAQKDQLFSKMVNAMHANHGLDHHKTKEFADHKYVESDKGCYRTVHAKIAQTTAEEMVSKRKHNTPNVSQTNANLTKF
jgi:hypothetical protein